jgi:hypothetical protein
MSDSSIKYIVPKLNKAASDIDSINSSQQLVDSFCVVGTTNIAGEDEEENPIIININPLAYTYDGITYQSSTSPIVLNTITKVDFNGYQWVACGYNVNETDSLLLSSDGINWTTPVDNVLPVSIFDVVYGQKKWVAIGINDSENYVSRVAYSSDGMNWTLAAFNSDNGISGFFCIAYNGSYFLIGAINRIMKSSDGITWTNVDVTNILGAVRSITWNGNIWVAGGNNTHPIGYSYDGVTWNYSTSADLIINSGNTVVYNGTLFLAGGTGLYKLISSKDGINWTGVMLDTDETYLPGSISDITWNGTYWIVTNSTNDVTDPKIAYSSNLINWYKAGSANKLFNRVQDVNAITSRNRKNYRFVYA